MQGQELVEIDSSKTKEEGIYLMQREISCVSDGYIRHNPDAIAASIIQLICDDLKFKDMQNDTKYVLLNDRLKEAKKTLKVNKKNNTFKPTRKKSQKAGSKFYKKYKDRIESIQEAEIKMKVKAGIPIEDSTAQEKREKLSKKQFENKHVSKKTSNINNKKIPLKSKMKKQQNISKQLIILLHQNKK